MIRSVEGLENAEMMRTGYHEYDANVPHHLKNTLKQKSFKTYSLLDKQEEAASKGLYAGINAVRKIAEKSRYSGRKLHLYRRCGRLGYKSERQNPTVY